MHGIVVFYCNLVNYCNLNGSRFHSARQAKLLAQDLVKHPRGQKAA